MKRDKHFGQL